MMKAGERPNSKLLRGGRQESRRFRLLAIVVGFFIVSLTFVLVSKPDAILFGLNGKLPADQAPTSILIQQKVNTPAQKTSTDAIIGGDPKVVDDETYVKPKEIRGGEEEDHRVLSEPDPASGMTEPSATPNKDGNARKSSDETLGGERKDEEEEEREEKHTKVTLPTVSNYTIHDAEDTENAKQEVGHLRHEEKNKKRSRWRNMKKSRCTLLPVGKLNIAPSAALLAASAAGGRRRSRKRHALLSPSFGLHRLLRRLVHHGGGIALLHAPHNLDGSLNCITLIPFVGTKGPWMRTCTRFTSACWHRESTDVLSLG